MKKRINIGLTVIALIAIMSVTMGITIVYYNIFQNQVKEDLKQNATILVETEVFQNIYNNDIERDVLKNIKSGNIRITWIDTDGKVLFDNDTDITGMQNHINRPEIVEAFAGGEGESVRHSDTMNMNTYYYAILLENGTVLRISTQARTITNVYLAALPVIAVIAVGILLICILLGHLLTRQIMKPLELMAENLDERSAPEYKELEPFADKIRSQHENILAAVKSRQDFTANVSHELKTPITAISGYAEIIENKLYDEDSETHIAKMIRHNAERLLSIVNDIIKLSELDHSEISRKFEPVDLYEVCLECADDLEPMAENKKVSVSVGGEKSVIMGDRALIHEMVDNLIQNGIRYNKENGSLYICVTNEESHPILSVRDTGIGIEPDQIERIFERFYRVDKSRSRETGGTGLGLAIVKHIVEIHSAKINVKSEPGEGTEITVSF